MSSSARLSAAALFGFGRLCARSHMRCTSFWRSGLGNMRWFKVDVIMVPSRSRALSMTAFSMATYGL
jgi:hypothetical protein